MELQQEQEAIKELTGKSNVDFLTPRNQEDTLKEPIQEMIETASFRWDVLIIWGLIVIWGLMVIDQYCDPKDDRTSLGVIWVAAGIIGIAITPRPTRRKKQWKVEPVIKQKNIIPEIINLVTILSFIGALFFKHNSLFQFSIACTIIGQIYETLSSRGQRGRILKFYKRIYFKHGIHPYIFAILSITITAGLSFTLYKIGPNFLNAQLFDLGSNVYLSLITLSNQWGGWSLAMLTFIPLFLLLPKLALLEEKFFRKGRVFNGQMVRGAIIFGLSHGVAGIPLYAAVALIVPGICFGLFYQHQYRKFVIQHQSEKRAEILALFPAASMHTIYNSIIVTICFVALIIQ